MSEFVILSTIGKGSFGECFLAIHSVSREKVVLKKIPLQNLPSSEVESVRKECRLLQQLDHPHIVKYKCSFVKNDALFIGMEYAQSGDLEHFLRSQFPLKESDIWELFIELCSALCHVHSRKTIHRDVKPANIFLDSNRRIKLGDFGIARVLQGGEKAQTMIGTPYYLAPEICQGHAYDAKVDVWSVGCVLYEMITGKRAFEGRNIASVAFKICEGNYEKIPRSSGCSREIVELVAKLLVVDPVMRPSMQQILNEYGAFAPSWAARQRSHQQPEPMIRPRTSAAQSPAPPAAPRAAPSAVAPGHAAIAGRAEPPENVRMMPHRPPSAQPRSTHVSKHAAPHAPHHAPHQQQQQQQQQQQVRPVIDRRQVGGFIALDHIPGPPPAPREPMPKMGMMFIPLGDGNNDAKRKQKKPVAPDSEKTALEADDAAVANKPAAKKTAGAKKKKSIVASSNPASNSNIKKKKKKSSNPPAPAEVIIASVDPQQDEQEEFAVHFEQTEKPAPVVPQLPLPLPPRPKTSAAPPPPSPNGKWATPVESRRPVSARLSRPGSSSSLSPAKPPVTPHTPGRVTASSSAKPSPPRPKLTTSSSSSSKKKTSSESLQAPDSPATVPSASEASSPKPTSGKKWTPLSKDECVSKINRAGYMLANVE